MKRPELPPPRVDVLPCGLTLARIPTSRPLVATALAYRVGARDDPEGLSGSAHFLEHLMFRGAERFGPGEIDRTTRRLGGTDNAWTSHDTTLYHFSFAADRWTVALDMESDRMRGLTLDPDVVVAERQIVLEEIAMYEAEPWDVLEQEAFAAHFGEHPYGRPVLGTREDLGNAGPEEMRRFHERWMRPENAVLAVAGDTEAGDEAAVLERVAEAFADWPERPPAVAARPPRPPARTQGARLEQRIGEVPRLMMVLPGPEAAAEHDAADLRLALALLAHGRSSRLQRRLVDEEELCVWVTADQANMVEPGCVTVAAELHDESEPERVEAILREELARIVREPIETTALERARRVLLADWLFGHERADQLAGLWASTLCWLDAGSPERFLERLVTARPEDVNAAAARWLGAEPVVAWALPEGTTAG